MTLVMKTIKDSSVALFLVAALLCSLTVGAQPVPDRPGRRGPDRPDAPPYPQRPDRPGMAQRPFAQGQMMARVAPGLERVLSVLSDEQRRSIRNQMVDHREKMRDLEQNMRHARMQLLDAAVLEHFNERVVRAKAMDVARLEAERSVILAVTLSKIEPPLSREQIERIRSAPPVPGGAQGDRQRPYRDRMERRGSELPPRDAAPERPRRDAPPAER